MKKIIWYVAYMQSRTSNLNEARDENGSKYLMGLKNWMALIVPNWKKNRKGNIDRPYFSMTTDNTIGIQKDEGEEDTHSKRYWNHQSNRLLHSEHKLHKKVPTHIPPWTSTSDIIGANWPRRQTSGLMIARHRAQQGYNYGGIWPYKQNNQIYFFLWSINSALMSTPSQLYPLGFEITIVQFQEASGT